MAEDVLQEAYLEALKQADRIRAPDRLIPWLKTVGKRIAINEYKTHKQVARKYALLTETAITIGEDDWINHIAISDAVKNSAQGFPGYYAAVVRYRYFYGMPYKQIADLLGISVVAARQANARVVKKLRIKLIF